MDDRGRRTDRLAAAMGTVWIAVFAHEEPHSWEHRFDGEPSDICAATCEAALERAHQVLGAG